MFKIEYLIIHNRVFPDIVVTETSDATHFMDAAASAKARIEVMRKDQASTPPDGFRLKDARGFIVYESWEARR